MPPTATADAVLEREPTTTLDTITAAAPADRPAETETVFIVGFGSHPDLKCFDFGGQIYVGVTDDRHNEAAEQARRDAAEACRKARGRAKEDMFALLTELMVSSPESLAAQEAANRVAGAKDDLARLDALVRDLTANWEAMVADGQDVVEVERQLVEHRVRRELVAARVGILERAVAAAREKADAANWAEVRRSWAADRDKAVAEYEAFKAEFAQAVAPLYLRMRELACLAGGYESLPHDASFKRLRVHQG